MDDAAKLTVCRRLVRHCAENGIRKFPATRNTTSAQLAHPSCRSGATSRNCADEQAGNPQLTVDNGRRTKGVGFGKQPTDKLVLSTWLAWRTPS